MRTLPTIRVEHAYLAAARYYGTVIYGTRRYRWAVPAKGRRYVDLDGARLPGLAGTVAIRAAVLAAVAALGERPAHEDHA